jgi:thioredoxin reductase (NADPH)
MSERYEAIIIGGGPAGLTAGLYLMRGGIKTILLEKVLPGGAPLNTGRIENYPGFPDGISGRELMDRFAAHAKAFGLPVGNSPRSWASRRRRVLHGDGERRKPSQPGSHSRQRTEPVRMGIPVRASSWKGYLLCATCDGMFFRDLDVAVIGGGDSAIEEARRWPTS